MSKTVIVGAGPIGLYLAVRLAKAGLNNLVVYDPRAGEYTRPGHLNHCVFEKVHAVLGEDFQLLPKGTTAHIKDLERKLYALAIAMGIQIEKKEFMGFHQHGVKGIFIKDEALNQSFIECDYAFDCTGSQRRLIHAVNEHYPEEIPFKIEPVVKHRLITTYFLAYVKMDKENYERLVQSSREPPIFSSMEYIRLLHEWQAYGWKEYSFPDWYEGYFTKDKICFYMECPDNLPVEHYDGWVKLVFKSTAKQPIIFEQLAMPKSGRKKPRFHSFISDPKALNPVSYQGGALPMVVAQGDAQIGSHHELAHGVKDGLERVNLLFNHLTITDGTISDFDAENYSSALKPLLLEHSNLLIAYYKNRIQEICEDFPRVIQNYKNVLSCIGNSHNRYKNQLLSNIRILEIRQAYYNAFIKLQIVEDLIVQGHTCFSIHLEKEVSDIAAASRLPDAYDSEKKQAKTVLIRFMEHEIKQGRVFFERKEYRNAILAFTGASNLFQRISIREGDISILNPSYLLLLVNLIQFIDQQPNYDNHQALLSQKTIITELIMMTSLTADDVKAVIYQITGSIYSEYGKKPVQQLRFFSPGELIESVDITLKRNYQTFVAFVGRYFGKQYTQLFDEAVMLTTCGSYQC